MLFGDQILAPLLGREWLYYSNTKDSSLILCVEKVAKELTITGSKIGGQKHCTKNSFAFGKIVQKQIFPIEVLTKALLQGCRKSRKITF